MITDKEFFDTEMKQGFSPLNPDYKNLHYNLADWIIKNCTPSKYFEIGAGMGTCLERVIEKNVSSFGFDPNTYHVDFWKERNDIYKHLYTTDYKKALKELRLSDTVCAIECMEHMTDETIIEYLEEMEHAKFFVFSSTHKKTPNDESWGHINVKEQSEWDELFSRFGWKVSDKKPPITQWAKMYVK